MWQGSITPSITVTIGQQTRLYFAFVTTAPSDLDSPATVTLYEGPFSDVLGFAADALTLPDTRSRVPARLLLVDAPELEPSAPVTSQSMSHITPQASAPRNQFSPANCEQPPP
jgi:hypothetical protein